MTHPKPCPPARRLQNSIDAAANRSGVTVRVVNRQGMVFWSVARTEGCDLHGVLSGVMVDGEAGPQRGILHDRLDRAVRRVRADAAEAVYCAEETGMVPSTLQTALGVRGHQTTSDYPPAHGLVATGAAIQVQLRSFYRRVEVSTDASAGKRGWIGAGWMIDFGQGSRLRLGQQARRGGSILEAELRAILLGVQDATRRIPHHLVNSCELVVRSDSKWALRMITQPGWSPLGASRAAVEQAALIRTVVRGLMVDFTWVKGHDGDRGNETADRLALMSRRHAELGLPTEVLEAKVEALRLELQEAGTAVQHALAA
ncbi:ribonuclease HI [Micrococcus sp. TA1]|uniref:ribonuclease HI n=1 Tax=Micrococcus sp. TA1 TaxID=681627 RepID=UPI00160E936C|nr:RNase H family protein [Micrococcus sp. TA1]MBB5750108.1 ribonuclease HI [Micrococcus sp. TA1]